VRLALSKSQARYPYANRAAIREAAGETRGEGFPGWVTRLRRGVGAVRYFVDMPKLTDDERNVAERRHLIEILLSDSERQLAANAGTASALGTRAAILIASASIVTGLQLARPSDAAWYLLALIAAGVAALGGVIVVLPRRGHEADLREIETLAWNETDTIASRRLLHTRLAILNRDKGSLFWRAIVLVAAFVILIVALACACLQLANFPAPFDWSV
jgi:hypothetical protein